MSPPRTPAAPGPSRSQIFPGPRASDRFPDVLLTTHRGRRVRFATDLVRDRIVVAHFLYTRCDGSCPGTVAAVEALRPRLTERLGPACVILSLTLDPANDTPEALSEYADQFGARHHDPRSADWLFLTGDRPDLERVRRGVGLSDPDPRIDADKAQHASLLLFGDDRTNRWSALPVGMGEDALLKAILRVAGVGRDRPGPLPAAR